jgi:hypothetical protein
MTADDRPDTDQTPETEQETWPIGFLIIVALAALYLGWRLVQSVGWVIDKL